MKLQRCSECYTDFPAHDPDCFTGYCWDQAIKLARDDSVSDKEVMYWMDKARSQDVLSMFG